MLNLTSGKRLSWARLFFACWKFDAARKLRWMQEWLTRHGTHIEIGSGSGSVLDVMRRQNYAVDGLDIRDTSFRQDLRPVLYEGEVMPFEDSTYDIALADHITSYARP